MSTARVRAWAGQLSVGTWAVFGFTAGVYMATANYSARHVNGDTLTAALASWALAVKHTVNVRWLGLYPSQIGTLWLVHGAHGSIVTNRFPGAILLGLPFYALTGGSSPGFAAGSLAAALCAAAAVAVVYRLLAHLASAGAALAGAGVLAFGTATWTVSAAELWEHAGAQLCLASGMLALLCLVEWSPFSRHQTLRLAVAGIPFGAAVLFRPHLAVIAGVVAVYVWRREGARRALWFAAGVAPGVAGYLAWNWLLFGRLTLTGGYNLDGPQKAAWAGVGPRQFFEGIAGTLVSPERGVLICTPLLLVAVLGLRPAWRRAAPMVRMFAVAGGAYLLVQLWLFRFSGGDGFVGSRLALESLTMAAPLLLLAGIEAWRRVPVVTVGLGGWTLAVYAAGAIAPGDLVGIDLNPWTHWAPLQLAGEYPGSWRLAVGAVFVVAPLCLASLFVGRLLFRIRRSAL